MDDFLEKFFNSVYLRKLSHNYSHKSKYCIFNNLTLQVFTSSLYLAGIIATFFASYITQHLGRQRSIVVAGFFFIIGVVFGATAQNLGMLIIGRIFLGCGVGFANQVIHLPFVSLAFVYQSCYLQKSVAHLINNIVI
jgi:MFS transporter, SP family, sugar:H+ symporter